MQIRILLPLLSLLLVASATAQSINIDPPTRSFAREGGGGSILTSGTGTWEATTDESWITITPRTSGNAGESCIYVVSANMSADTRQGIIHIGGKTHTITQLGYTATLAPSSQSVDFEGGEFTIEVTVPAGVSWSASASEPWISVLTPSGNGSGTVAYSVAAYTGVATRTASIVVGSQTFTVSQSGRDVNMSPVSVLKQHSSDIILVDVRALTSTTWSVTSHAPWISVVDPGNGFGDAQVIVAIGTNPSFLERSGTVSIGSSTLTIRQRGTPVPLLDIQPKEATADPVGAFANIAVIATPDAPWTAESLSSWIVLSSTSGEGNGNLGYVASANPTLDPRVGTVRVHAPFVPPLIDLTKALLAHIPTGNLDQSGWLRHIEGPIETRFDGSFRRTLSGHDVHTDVDAGSLALRFSVENTGSIHRLAGIDAHGQRTALFITADDRIAFRAEDSVLVSDFAIDSGVEYQVVVTADPDRSVSIYAGAVGEEISIVGTATFAMAPFAFSTPTPANAVTIGYADLPSSGFLNGAVIQDFRLHGHALNADEAAAIFEHALTTTPYGPQPHQTLQPRVSYNLRGQAMPTGGTTPPTATSKTYNIVPETTTGLTGPIAEYSSTSGLPAIPEGTETDWTTLYNLQAPGHSWGPLEISVDMGPLEISVDIFNSVRSSCCIAKQRVEVEVRIQYADGTSDVEVFHNYREVRDTQTSSRTTTHNLNLDSSRGVQSLRIRARYQRVLPVGHGRDALFSYSVKADLSVGDSVPKAISGIVTPHTETADRFFAPQRALKGSGERGLFFWSQQSSFTGNSATYNLWLRCEQLPTATNKAPIFSRSALDAHFLRADLDAQGRIHLSNGSQNAVIEAGLMEKQWQMLTFTGASGGNLTVYVDGEEVGNTNVFGTYLYGRTNTDPAWMYVGGWNGAVSDIAFYEGALTSSQVSTIYQEQRALFVDHVVTQGVVDPALTVGAATLPANGGTATTDLILAGNVNWTASSSAEWLQITGSTSGAGSRTLEVFADENPSVSPRVATITIAGKSFEVTQEGQPSQVDAEEVIFSTDGGSAWIDVTVGGSAQWTASSDVPWLTVAIGESGSGSGFVFIVADPYTNTSQSRSGSVTVANQTIFFTQRGYQLSIHPEVAEIGSNAGAGEFGVSAPIGSVWEAIVTQPWITLIGGSTGIGDGILRYSIAENTTGASRTGRIIVAGEEYTITQTSTFIVTVTAGSGGSASGGGNFEVNGIANLAANPSEGYRFSHWTGDAVGSANPLTLNVDSDKEVTAVFIPESAALSLGAGILDNPNEFNLFTPEQIHAMHVNQPVVERDPVTEKLTIRLGLFQSQNLTDWTPVNLQSSEMFIRNGKVEFEVTPSTGGMFYIIEADGTSR